jgi:hypothetical protein
MPVQVVGGSVHESRNTLVHQINPGYLKALGIALVQGRGFTESEVSGKRSLALVNQAFVRRMMEGGDPLGRVLRFPENPDVPELKDISFEVVGVVKDTHNGDLGGPVLPEVYLPYTVAGMADRLVVRAQSNPAALVRAILARVHEVDKDQPVTDVYTVRRMVSDRIYAGPRFNLTLLSVFAGLGLALAVIGIYGVMSDSVAQQTREIGVRIAVGATPGQVAAMILKRGSRLLFLGIVLGLAGSYVVMRLIAQKVWNVPSFDPIAFGGVALILLAAGLLACGWPACCAARVDPMSALRDE